LVVVVAVSTPVSWLCTTICALGITAPDESVTCPVNTAFCPNSAVEKRPVRTISVRNLKVMDVKKFGAASF
jgi:hypothetical protein